MTCCGWKWNIARGAPGLFIFIFLLLHYYGCGERGDLAGHSTGQEYFYAEGRWIKDPRGRVFIPWGLNVSDANKHPDPGTGDFFPPWLGEEQFDRLVEWGFNCIRLLIIWEAIEPERGVFDDGYLRGVDRRIEWARERGIKVILDMHQDLYSRIFGGDGAPDWAVLVDHSRYKPIQPWYLNYFSTEVMEAFDGFWANDVGIQDEFIGAWAHVAQRYANDKTVIGYDLFNEPGAGSLITDIRTFERNRLQPFYERLIGRMREFDANHLYLFEPTISKGGGLPCYLTAMKYPNLVFAPHYYDPTVMWVNPYDGNKDRHDSAFALIEGESAGMGTPWWLGEYGIIKTTRGAHQYVIDQCRLLEKYMAGSAYWSYDRDEGGMGIEDPQGEEEWLLDVLSRTYPQYIAGIPQEYSFDDETKVFRLIYRQNKGAKGPTVIYVPEGRHYPNGFDIESSDPEGSWVHRWNEVNSSLEIESDPQSEVHTIIIRQKK